MLTESIFRRCLNCGKPFLFHKIESNYFCSIDCKINFQKKKKQENEYTDSTAKQIEMDLKAERKAKEDRYMLSRYYK